MYMYVFGKFIVTFQNKYNEVRDFISGFSNYMQYLNFISLWIEIMLVNKLICFLSKGFKIVV